MMQKRGLSRAEAAKKLKENGYNEIKEILHVSALQILLRQIKNNFIVYLLLFAAILSFIVGKDITAYTILIIIIVIVATGFIQEYKAERSIKALRQMLVPISIVIREGKEIEVPSREIVPEEIVVLRNGDKVPADCLVLEEKELQVNESILSGESQAVRKYALKNENSQSPQGAGYKKTRNYLFSVQKARAFLYPLAAQGVFNVCDTLDNGELMQSNPTTTSSGVSQTNEKRSNPNNILYMATHIVNGRCIAKVLHTGMNTKFGEIAKMISTAEKELPLQKKVNKIARYMVFVALFISILTGSIMLIKNLPLSSELLIEIIVVVIALSVSAFPEGLPVVLISTLASGAHRMSKKNAIVNRMSIIETLGETTVICADKTGTITKGEMTAKNIWFNDKIFKVTGTGYNVTGEILPTPKSETFNLLLKTAVLCNDGNIEREGSDKAYNIRGNPTEAALLIMAAKAGIFKEDLQFTREEEIPFSSDRKIMSVLCKEKSGNFVYAKGAPEKIIDSCQFVKKDGKIIQLSPQIKKDILKTNYHFTSNTFRVIALAYKPLTSFKKEDFEQDLIFLGLVALEDPPREEVKSTLKICKEAGIKVKMITGDNRDTAIQIGKEIGLNGEVITGEELDRITDDELSKRVQKIVIFARVRPEHKLRIVKALKQNKEIVAMTGDGVNDAPALKEAHIGIAMGRNGTDASREVSDLILKDDNFATIVAAISEGRTIFNNIRKFVTYQLSCNYAELFTIFLGVLLGLPLPLLALQILFMNLITDDLPSITLGFNPASRDVMKSKPRQESNILNKHLIFLMITTGIIMSIITLGVFYFTLNYLNQDLVTARTLALVTLIFLEIANAFNFRSLRSPVYKLPLFANKYLVYASGLSILATILIIYTPLNQIFETTPLAWNYFLGAAVAALPIIILFDIFKLIKKDLSGEKS